MSSKANAGEGFEHACEQALEACARGLPLRHLRSCAIVTDVGRMHLTACERQERRGPYPLYVRVRGRRVAGGCVRCRFHT